MALGRSFISDQQQSSTHLGFYYFIICIVHLLCIAPASAQHDCTLALIEADKAYQTGQFNQVIDLLTPCVGSNISVKEKVAIYRLMALTHLSTDHTDLAENFVTRLLTIKPNFETTLQDPPLFTEIVEEVKLELASTQVSSVSKNNESLLEAPATVILITEEEIKRRGYQDLEALFHDLPGFDISRGNGVQYSLIYQRGYRSNGTDKTLFLIDDVEENDLWTNFTYLSRQYPLSNIKRIEIIHGPASTMYGANAFLGVVNIITKEPGNLVKKGKKFGANIQVSNGQLTTRYVDATVAARHENIAMSVTGRIFRSHERDLSDFPDWDYQTHPLPFYQDKLAITGTNEDGSYRAQTFLEENNVDPDHPYISIVRDANNVAQTINITETGAQQARDIDQATLNQIVEGNPVRYTNHTNDWLLNAKIRSEGFTLGFQTWRRAEGTIGWFVDDREGTSENGGVWIPRNTFLYMKYDKSINENLFLTFFTRYKSHSLDSDNKIVIFRSYAGEGRWGLSELLEDRQGFWFPLWFYRLSKELRIEAKGLYVPSEKFNIVAGIEARNGHIQGNYVTSISPNPSETGDHSPQAGGNHFENRDIGVYGQASYKPHAEIKLVLGGRIDNNKTRDTRGYGTVLNSRAAAVYTPANFVFKGVYSEAFKAASNWAKYATSPSRGISNPELQPERVKNIELSAGWQIRDGLFVDLATYSAAYTDVVGTAQITQSDGSTTTQNQAIGRLEIRGLQANTTWKYENYALYGNYTYTNPKNVEPTDSDGNLITDVQGNPLEVRIGDIASHQINIGVNANYWNHLNVNLRLNYVGAKKTGKNTTVEANPLDEIGAYTTLNGAITLENVLPNASLQITASNILNKEYAHPGARSADGKILAAMFPQNRRNIMLRLLADF